jgi:virginiamycin B lyase
MVAGPDGSLWMAQPGGSKLSRITTAGIVTEFPVTPLVSTKDPAHLTVGPDGNIWFTMQTPHSIGRLTTAGVMTLFDVSADPVAIAPGPDGALWYLGFNASRVGRITTDGAWSEYQIAPQFSIYPGLGGNGSWPNSIIAGSDGNVWFTEQGTGKIAYVDRAQATFLTATAPTTARKNVLFSGAHRCDPWPNVRL